MASERMFCPGPSRRDVLRIGSLGVLGLGLADFLRLKALANPPAAYETPEIIAPKATNCILVWQSGGPSHIDTWDPKPDAPKDVKGEFKPIDTAVPGLRISEVLPNLAQIADKFTIIRSMTSPEAEHDRATHHMLTGYRPSPALVYPSYGSVIAKIQENRESVLPAYVAAPDAPLFSASGYLTPAYNPFEVGGDPNAPTFRVRDLTPPDELTLKRLRRRQAMVHKLDAFTRGGQTALTKSRDKFSERAYDLITSAEAQKAFQLDVESAETRERYGRTTLGQTCMMARRLVEAGVPFVTINDRGVGNLGWDTHAQNFQSIKTNLAPSFDKAVSTLIRDLEERGLLETTLVIAMGEFGRTPKINPNSGRDHHGRANSILIAGAGIPRGLALGKTDAKGEGPIERPVTPADLAATIYHLLGINPETRFHTPDGQPVRLVDQGARLTRAVRQATHDGRNGGSRTRRSPESVRGPPTLA